MFMPPSCHQFSFFFLPSLHFGPFSPLSPPVNYLLSVRLGRELHFLPDGGLKRRKITRQFGVGRHPQGEEEIREDPDQVDSVPEGTGHSDLVLTSADGQATPLCTMWGICSVTLIPVLEDIAAGWFCSPTQVSQLAGVSLIKPWRTLVKELPFFSCNSFNRLHPIIVSFSC